MASPESATTTAATASAATIAEVQSPLAHLRAQFDYDPASRSLQVRYRLDNTSGGALAVFDRGNAHAVGTGRLQLGQVGAPTQRQQGGDVELFHVVSPLPNPSPTAPPTPLALRLEPGAQVEASFRAHLLGADAPARLRWCLGLMRFDEGAMRRSTETEAGPVWLASFGASELQQVLCTPWYEVEAGRFQE